MKQNICCVAYTLEILTRMDLEKNKGTTYTHFLFLYGFICFPKLIYLGLQLQFFQAILKDVRQWLKFSLESRWNVEDNFVSF